MISSRTKLEFTTRLAHSSELRAMVAVDDAASGLYAEAGLNLHLDPTHPFVVAEAARWMHAITTGRAYVAVDAEGQLIGFITLGFVDGAPYLDQISVHPRMMRRGVGGALMSRALSLSATDALWLTTYAHLSWNRPYYERFGFITVPERECGPALKQILDHQRAVLPAPDMRMAMRRTGCRQ